MYTPKHNKFAKVLELPLDVRVPNNLILSLLKMDESNPMKYAEYRPALSEQSEAEAKITRCSSCPNRKKCQYAAQSDDMSNNNNLYSCNQHDLRALKERGCKLVSMRNMQIRIPSSRRSASKTELLLVVLLHGALQPDIDENGDYVIRNIYREDLAMTLGVDVLTIKKCLRSLADAGVIAYKESERRRNIQLTIKLPYYGEHFSIGGGRWSAMRREDFFHLVSDRSKAEVTSFLVAKVLCRESSVEARLEESKNPKKDKSRFVRFVSNGLSRFFHQHPESEATFEAERTTERGNRLLLLAKDEWDGFRYKHHSDTIMDEIEELEPDCELRHLRSKIVFGRRYKDTPSFALWIELISELLRFFSPSVVNRVFAKLKGLSLFRSESKHGHTNISANYRSGVQIDKFYSFLVVQCRAMVIG